MIIQTKPCRQSFAPVLLSTDLILDEIMFSNFRKSTFRLFALGIFLLALVCLPGMEARAGQDGIEVFAHRGLAYEQPENSLAAIKAAMDLGLDGCEVDLRTTRDHVLVLMHDPTLERTTTGRGRVKEKTYAELCEFKLKDKKGRATGLAIPSLEQALTLVKKKKGFRLALDMKDCDPKALGQAVLQAGAQKRVIFSISGEAKTIQARALKDLNRNLFVSFDLGTWWKIEGIPTFAAQSLGAEALFCAEWNFPKYGFREAKDAGVQVIVFLWGTKDLAKRAKRAFLLGADIISCDCPGDILFLRKE